MSEQEHSTVKVIPTTYALLRQPGAVFCCSVDDGTQVGECDD